MAHLVGPKNDTFEFKLICLEVQLKAVRTTAVKCNTLENEFKDDHAKIYNDFTHFANFKTKLDTCFLECAQLGDLTRNSELKEISALVKTRLDELHAKLPVVFTQHLDPKIALLPIADKFKCHKTKEALGDFSRFATRFPKLAQRVYDNLWSLKGSPFVHLSYGHRAFHNLDGYYSQDSEKAEAILLLHSSPQDWLDKLRVLFIRGNKCEALSELKEFSAMYPKVTGLIFEKPIDLQSDLSEIVQVIDQTNVDINELMSDPIFCLEQDIARKGLRSIEVTNEHILLLKQGYYVTPSGTNCSIQIDLEKSIKNTIISFDGGFHSPKTSRFDATAIEMRVQNCVSIAYALAMSGKNKVNVMNIAHPYIPGGAYQYQAGSQEQELFRCSGLPLALDRNLGTPVYNFYPIHHHDVAGEWGSLYASCVPIIRLGMECDYQLVEKPACISVGTFAAFSQDPYKPVELAPQLKERIRSHLKAAYNQGDDTLIIGALSCVDNPSGIIAELTLEVIEEEYVGCFERIIFAVSKEDAEGHGGASRENFYRLANAVKKSGGVVCDGEGKEMV